MLQIGSYLASFLETLYLTKLMAPPGYDLSLALYHPHRLCWVKLLPQAVLLTTDPHKGGGNIYLYSETNTWISSPHASVSPQSSNWHASFSQNFFFQLLRLELQGAVYYGITGGSLNALSLGLM